MKKPILFSILKNKYLLMGIALPMLQLSGCSGSSSSGEPNTQSGNSTLWKGGALQSLSLVQGTWIQGRCVALTGGSVKNYYKVTPTQADKASLASGNLFYSGNSSCSGTATDLGETHIGEATFLGTDDYGVKKYYYSSLTTVSGLVQNFIFALKDNSTICIFNRTDDLVTADQVNSFVDAISNTDCHFK